MAEKERTGRTSCKPSELPADDGRGALLARLSAALAIGSVAVGIALYCTELADLATNVRIGCTVGFAMQTLLHLRIWGLSGCLRFYSAGFLVCLLASIVVVDSDESWHFCFILVLDFVLLMQSEEDGVWLNGLPYLFIAGVISYMILCVAPVFEMNRVLDFSRPSEVFRAALRFFSTVVTVVLNFALVRSYVKEARSCARRLDESLTIASRIAGALGDFDLDAADALIRACDCAQSPVVEPLARLHGSLRGYRPFLPNYLFPQVVVDGDPTSDRALARAMRGQRTSWEHVASAVGRMRDPDYSLKAFHADMEAAFPELRLYAADERPVASLGTQQPPPRHSSSGGRTGLEEYQRTLGALYSVYCIARLDLNGRNVFTFGVDDDWEPLSGSPPSGEASAELLRRSSFYAHMEWDKLQDLFVRAGLLVPAHDRVDGEDHVPVGCEGSFALQAADSHFGGSVLPDLPPAGCGSGPAHSPQPSETASEGRARAPSSLSSACSPNMQAVGRLPSSPAGVVRSVPSGSFWAGARQESFRSHVSLKSVPSHKSIQSQESFSSKLRRKSKHSEISFAMGSSGSFIGTQLVVSNMASSESASDRFHVHDERMTAFLVLTAVHDVMKNPLLLPTVQRKHAPYHGISEGSKICDHDLALTYIMEHFSGLLPSFHGLEPSKRAPVFFSQGKMGFNNGWLVQGEAPPGALFSTFKEMITLGGASEADISFYFAHWLTDLAGAEAFGLRPWPGSEKFVLKFPMEVLLAFLDSFTYVDNLVENSEVQVMEEYLRDRWHTLGPPAKVVPEGCIIAAMRLALMAQGFEPAAMDALRQLPASDRNVLAAELARTGLRQQFAGAPAEVRSQPRGPALLIYYAPGLIQKAGAPHVGEALQILAALCRAARRLFPLDAAPHLVERTVVVRIEAMKVLSPPEIRAAGTWLLRATTAEYAVAELCSAQPRGLPEVRAAAADAPQDRPEDVDADARVAIVEIPPLQPAPSEVRSSLDVPAPQGTPRTSSRRTSRCSVATPQESGPTAPPSPRVLSV